MHPVWAYCGLGLLWDRDRLQPIGGNLEHIGAGRSAGLVWKLEQFIQFAPVVRINPPGVVPCFTATLAALPTTSPIIPQVFITRTVPSAS